MPCNPFTDSIEQWRKSEEEFRAQGPKPLERKVFLSEPGELQNPDEDSEASPQFFAPEQQPEDCG
jgi:hypothetical protein